MKKLLTLILLLAGLSFAPAYAQTKKEVKQLEKFSKNGNIDATQKLYNIYHEGKGEIAKDEFKAQKYAEQFIKQLEAKAAAGDKACLQALHQSYKTGNELFQKDEAKAKHYGILLIQEVEKDAKEGNMDALELLPHYYNNGIYVDKDAEKAAYWEHQYQMKKAAVLGALKRKAYSYYSGREDKDNSQITYLMQCVNSQEEAEAVYAGIMKYYYERTYRDEKNLFKEQSMQNMVDRYCSDIVKIHYSLISNSVYKPSNLKISNQLKEYLMICLAYDKFGIIEKRLDDLKKLSAEGFAPATYKLISLNINDNHTNESLRDRMSQNNDLMKTAQGQKLDLDMAELNKMHKIAPELKVRDDFYATSSKDYRFLSEIEFLLNCKQEAEKVIAYNEKDTKKRESQKAEYDKKVQDIKEYYAKNLAACRKQYGAKYVDALERLTLLPGTPYKLLLEYCKDGRLYRYVPAGYEAAVPIKYITIYKGSQGMNFTNYTVHINNYYKYKVQVRNGIVTWVGSRYI